jgi:DNA-directed RNA polymerase specialized sigma24 family protein
MKNKCYEIELEHFGKVYVSKEVKDLLEEEERKFQNYERKCRYWCPIRLDECEYEGELFVEDYDPKKDYLEKEEQLECNRFLELLTSTQKRRLLMRMENPSLSLREIARIEEVDYKSIEECFEAIKNKYKKFLNNTPSK